MAPTPPKPLLVMQTGDAPEPIRRACGNFDEMFYRMADLDPETTCIVHVARGELPDSPAAYRGVIVTGSPVMVTDRETWSDRAGEWLCAALDAGVPLFAVCYGHQLLAMCLGGEVGYHPEGEEVGSYPVTLTPEAAGEPLLAGLPGVFTANMAHRQAVLAPPPGAVVLAGSDHDPYQLLRYGDRVFTSQFHPEFDAAAARAYAGLYAQATPGKTDYYRTMRERCADTPEARELLTRFVRRCDGMDAEA